MLFLLIVVFFVSYVRFVKIALIFLLQKAGKYMQIFTEV